MMFVVFFAEENDSHLHGSPHPERSNEERKGFGCMMVYKITETYRPLLSQHEKENKNKKKEQNT